jgi:hypothetical protein
MAFSLHMVFGKRELAFACGAADEPEGDAPAKAEKLPFGFVVSETELLEEVVEDDRCCEHCPVEED